jgi:hypothetical protein
MCIGAIRMRGKRNIIMMHVIQGMRFFLIFLICALALLAGCAQNPPAPAVNQPGPAQNGSADGMAVAPDQGASENGSAGASGTQTGAPAGKTYSAKFSELAGMGKPLECEIRYTYGGKETEATIRFGADSEFLVESPKGVAQCAKTITVIRDTRQYVGCSDKRIVTGCDWFKSAYDKSTPGLASAFDFQNVPASSITCRDWAYDRSVFITNGTVCELR